MSQSPPPTRSPLPTQVPPVAPPAPAVTTAPPAPAPRSSLGTIWSIAQFVVALVLTVGVLIYLLTAAPSRPELSADAGAADDPVRVTGPYLIRLEPNTPLANKIQSAEVRPTRLTTAALTVTGTVVASLRPGAGVEVKGGWEGLYERFTRASDYWQFNSSEVLSTFTDWQKAKADLAFAREQFPRVRDAAVARTAAQRDLVATMVKLEAAGTETKKQLAVEQATLRQFEIQEKKEIHEAETAIRMSERAEAAAARQLQQVGLDPAMLGSVTADVDLVMADVPEGFLSRVKIGDGCSARFFGIPDQVFTGRVKSLAPVITKDRRSLRVLFTVDDLKDQLRPGMFAEIGVGTDPRDALLAPVDGVIHVGRTDYLLVATPDANVWRATPVEVGELRDGRIEVVRGLTAGNRVIGPGAVLLKPALARAVQPGGANGGEP